MWIPHARLSRPPPARPACSASRAAKAIGITGVLWCCPQRRALKAFCCSPILHRDPSCCSQGLSLFVLTGAAGILGILVISWFLTGRALQPARDGIRKQNEFVAAASHELRSPLAVIRSSLSALESELPGETGNQNQTVTLRQLIKNSDRECRRMARLVGDMLLLASSDAGNWELHYTQTEPDTLLIEAYEAFLPLCREKNIKPHTGASKGTRSLRFLPTGRDWSRLSRFSSTMPSPILRPERKYG